MFRPRHLVAITLLALAVAAGIAAHALAATPDRGDLRPPMIAVGPTGLAEVVYTEVGRPGLRLVRETSRNRWTRPGLLRARRPQESRATGNESAATAAYENDATGWVYTVRGGGERRAVAAALLIGARVDIARAAGTTVVLYREPIRGYLSVAFLRDGVRKDYAVSAGQTGSIALSPSGQRLYLASWDRSGRLLVVSTMRVGGSYRTLARGDPRLIDVTRTPVSALQGAFPVRDTIAVELAAAALALAVAGGLVLVCRRRPGARSLPFLVAGAVLAACAVRGAYVGYTGRYGLYPHDTLVLDAFGVKAVVDALLILAAATLALFLPALLPLRAPRALPRVALPDERGALRALIVFIALSVAGAAASLLIAGDVHRLLRSRQEVFAGKGYLLLLLAAAVGAYLVYLAVRLRSGSLRAKAPILFGVLLLPLTVATGARSAVLLGFVGPVLLLIHLRVRPFGIRSALAVLAVLVAFAVTYREVVRAPAAQAGGPSSAPPRLLERQLDPVLGASELNALDGLVLVRSQYLPRFGTHPATTIAALVAAPVPRALWPGKPRGAMDTFTARMSPFRYRLNHVGQTTSLAGEFAMDGGTGGILLGFAAFGIVLVLLGELAAGAGGEIAILLACAFVPRVASALWGESLNAALGGATVAVAIAAAILAGRALSLDRQGVGRAGLVPSSGR